MKLKYLFSIVIISLFLSSCTKTPEASFTVPSGKLSEKDNINFSNNSDKALSFKWDFGDGSTGTEANPVHSFEKEGVYRVVLEAFSKANFKGKSDVFSMDVTIENKYNTCSINVVKLIQFAGQDSAGNDWDADVIPFPPGSYGDLFLIYGNGNAFLDNNRLIHQSDINPSSVPISFTLNTPLVINIADSSQNYYFGLMDFDVASPLDQNSSDDLINHAMAVLNVGSLTSTYPSSYQVNSPDNRITLEFQLNWSE